MTRTKKGNKKCNSGFSLIELMLAAGILAFAVVGLLGTYVNGALLGLANHNLVIAVTDAQYVLEKLKDTPYADLATYTDGNFTNLPNESIRVAVTTLTNEKNVVANVTWTEGQKQRSYVLVTKIAW